MIAKNNETDQWFLDSEKYESYGCGYRPSHPDSNLEYPTHINNLQIWEKLMLDKTRPVSMFFPMNYPTLEFQVRHSSDPLMLALNITPEKGSFDFGLNSSEQLVSGIFGLCASVFISMLILYKF